MNENHKSLRKTIRTLNKKMKCLILIALFAVIALVLAAPECPENEAYNECGTACPRTCKNKDEGDIACIKICKPGCFCKESLVRNTESGKCVATRDC